MTASADMMPSGGAARSPARSVFLALHGFTGTGADFSALSRCVKGEWYCPDLPGHGTRSDALPGDFDPAALPSLLPPGDRPLTGVGYSLGGRLLLHLALQCPDRFEKLVLIGASPGLADETERAKRRRHDEHWIGLLRTVGVAGFLEQWWKQPVLAGLEKLPAEQWKDLRSRRLANEADGLARSLEYHGSGVLPALWDDLSGLEIPVTLVVGENDRKFRQIAGKMANRLPRATIEIIPATGHAPHLEKPAATASTPALKKSAGR